jgi:hypothetical protein
MAQAGQKKRGGKKQRKYGRNKLKCQVYRESGRRFKNKLRRVLKHNGPEAAALYRQTYR